MTADGTVCYVPEGFTDTILISKNVYPVHFTYRKSDGEGGYYSYEDVQYIPCGGSAVMPSLSEIEYDPVHHPFTEWLCENKPDDRRWMNVREELYYGAYYDYIPNPGQYTVTFVSWEDKLITEQTVSKFEDAVPPVPPTREGYHFIRWDGDYTFVTEDRRIRAVYGQDDVYWTVSFYNDGWYSDLLGTEQVADGEKAVGNMEVYMDDHVFIGWDKPLDEVHSDLNVAAQYEWREMEHHKVTIVAEHGTVTIRPRQVNPDFVNHGTVLFLEAVPDEGYKLSGWEGYSVQFGLAVTQDTTVTALFTPNTPTALEDATQSSTSPQKIFRNGILYILRGIRIYNLQGQEVK
ncbi:MAG: InlB B-repeat-containing protein [Paludibacteraceae bacterium]|nr:InlB B-repeat-containing protein [Paludibacteraceae bacterium]